MKNKSSRVNLKNNEMLVVIRHKNNLFKDIVLKVLNEQVKFKIMRDLIVAYSEFYNAEGVCFSSLDERDKYLEDEK